VASCTLTPIWQLPVLPRVRSTAGSSTATRYRRSGPQIGDYVRSRVDHLDAPLGHVRPNHPVVPGRGRDETAATADDRPRDIAPSAASIYADRRSQRQMVRCGVRTSGQGRVVCARAAHSVNSNNRSRSRATSSALTMHHSSETTAEVTQRHTINLTKHYLANRLIPAQRTLLPHLHTVYNSRGPTGSTD
jgi:hypothetical protein